VDTPVRVQRALPPNWNKLGLSQEQKDRIYQIRAEHGGKIQTLQKQITELKKAELTAMQGVLTDSQKTRLKEIAVEKLPKTGGESKPESKPKP
jgi:hypothetical protein